RISAPTILVRSKFAVGSSGAALMCPHLSGPPARPHRHPRRGNLWTKLLLPLSKVRLTALMSLHATEDTTSGVPQPLTRSVAVGTRGQRTTSARTVSGRRDLPVLPE